MGKPIVAIVGRPNVGKSTFFNSIIGKRISIVDNEPGVTRDRIYADTEWLGKQFTLADTGGLDPGSNDELLVHMRRQVEMAIDTADVIVFLADGKAGVTPADREVANILRKTKKPVLLAVNKIDTPDDEDLILEFYALAIGPVVGISASHKRGFGDLLDMIISYFLNRILKSRMTML